MSRWCVSLPAPPITTSCDQTSRWFL